MFILMLGLLMLALLGAALANSLGGLLAASLCIGLMATMAQILCQLQRHQRPKPRKVVGTVMTGLLLGILLARDVGGSLLTGLAGAVCLYWRRSACCRDICR